MCRVEYYDKISRKNVMGVIESVDLTVEPPSYSVHIPSLGVTRETVASRLQHLKQAGGAIR